MADLSKQALVWRCEEACLAQQESFFEILGNLPLTTEEPKIETVGKPE